MSQGFGSECQGIGGLLSPDNGLRRLKLTKVNLDVGECSFPDWVADTRVWNVIPRAGLRSVDDFEGMNQSDDKNVPG